MAELFMESAILLMHKYVLDIDILFDKPVGSVYNR